MKLNILQNNEFLKQIMYNFIKQIGGRKFVFACLAISIASIFVAYDKMTIADWKDFTLVIGSGYIIGNVANSYIQTKSSLKQDAIAQDGPIDFTKLITQPRDNIGGASASRDFAGNKVDNTNAL